MSIPQIVAIVAVVVGVLFTTDFQGSASALARHHRSSTSTAGEGISAKTTRGVQGSGAFVAVLGMAVFIAELS